MGSLGNPKGWVPFMNSKDCSQALCSLYCPQWCYIIFPPPPPPLVFSDVNSGPNFSPLVVAMIGILASAFLLVGYYAIISKYCGRNRNSTSSRANQETSVDFEDDYQDPSNHEPWHVANNGLDESLIKKITLLKYKRSDELIDITDCSVCLSEFQDDESLRLLPKCSHAFHVACIDTWLKTHSNCPMCRANIVFTTSLPLPPPNSEPSTTDNEPQVHNSQENNNSSQQQDVAEENFEADVLPKVPLRVSSDLGNSKCETIIDIRDYDERQQIRRCVSMDFASRGRQLCMADIMHITKDEDHIGPSKQPTSRSVSHRNRVLLCSATSSGMKRSFSSGRFSFSKLIW